MAARIVRVDPKSPDRSAIEDAVAVLRGGGLVALPTETVYGLGARAFDPNSIARIFKAKGRPTSHPLIAHVLDASDAARLSSAWPDVATRLAAHFWPGPLTLVVPRGRSVPDELTGGGETIAIRAPRHPVMRAVIAALGEPIAAPSANRYQTTSPTTAAHVMKSLGDSIDLIVDAGPCAEGLESTIVDARSASTLAILRPGPIDRFEIERVLGRALVIPSRSSHAPSISAIDAPHLSPGLDARHYAPRARLLVIATRDELCIRANAHEDGAPRLGLLVRGPLTSPLSPHIAARSIVTELSDEPRGYGRELFAALHRFDDAGVDIILVEKVPQDDRWGAIADRLTRASASNDP